MADEPDAKRARDTRASEAATATRVVCPWDLPFHERTKELFNAYTDELEASVGDADTYKAMKGRFKELKYVHRFVEADFGKYIQRCLLHGPDLIEVGLLGIGLAPSPAVLPLPTFSILPLAACHTFHSCYRCAPGRSGYIPPATFFFVAQANVVLKAV